MAEVAGLVVDSVALASLFSTCVDCFEDVQFAVRCFDDYATCQTKLDLLEIKFTRWGLAVGLDCPGNLKIQLNEAEKGTVVQVIKKIVAIFHECHDMSLKKDRRSAASPATQATFDPIPSLDIEQRSIHDTFRHICRRRRTNEPRHSELTDVLDRGGSSRASRNEQHEHNGPITRTLTGIHLRRRTSWALYSKGRFESLLSTVDDLVDDLIELFPAVTSQELQRIQVTDEIQEIEQGLVSVLGTEQIGAHHAIENAVVRALRRLEEVAKEENRHEILAKCSKRCWRQEQAAPTLSLIRCTRRTLVPFTVTTI